MDHEHPTQLVRELERRYPPENDRYAVFLGEFPRNRFFYCPDCPRGSGTTLGSILFRILRLAGVRETRTLFGKTYWFLDIFGSEVSEPERNHGIEVDSIEYGRIRAEVACLRDMMLKMKGGHLPMVIIPAMSRNPSAREWEQGVASTFAARVFRAIESFPDLESRFDRIFHNPWTQGWKANPLYVKEARESLTARGLLD